MPTKENKSDKLTFEIVEELGVIATYNSGWSKELNKVAWNDANPKFDIRDWEEGRNHMSKGVTLHTDEAEKLYELLGKALGK